MLYTSCPRNILIAVDTGNEDREGIKSARAHCGAAINELARQLKRTQF